MFQEARALAEQARELFREATTAQKAGDLDTYREKAVQVRDKLDRAMTITADWEVELITTYGSDDRQVVALGKEMDGWRKILNKVRKVK